MNQVRAVLEWPALLLLPRPAFSHAAPLRYERLVPLLQLATTSANLLVNPVVDRLVHFLREARRAHLELSLRSIGELRSLLDRNLRYRRHLESSRDSECCRSSNRDRASSSHCR